MYKKGHRECLKGMWRSRTHIWIVSSLSSC